MKQLFFLALLAAAAFPGGAQVPASEPAPQGDIITRQQAADILDELRQVRQLLQKQTAILSGARVEEPKPAWAKLNLKGVQMLGDSNAPITMVEFTDYQCPFCQRYHVVTFGELKKNYIDTGKVRYYARDMPLDFHKDAMRAAQAGRCAADQNQFWEMRDIMARDPNKLDMGSLVAAATKLKLDVNAFRTCVESGKHKNAVQTDVLEAMKLGADGTPTFVIGKSTADGVDGELVVGALPYSSFVEKIEELE